MREAKLTETKRETDNGTIIADFSITLSIMGRPRQQSKREIAHSNNTDHHLDLAGIYRTLCPSQHDVHSFQVHTEFSPE